MTRRSLPQCGVERIEEASRRCVESERARILVVDDDPKLLKTVAETLGARGFEAVTAGTGAEAITALRDGLVSVALIDLRLPDMPGLEVMERARAVSPLTETIILTAYASMDTAIEATRKGAFSYLLKPYRMEDLLRDIEHAVERQQARGEILRLASYPRLDPSPIIEVDAGGTVTYLNPAAERLFPGLDGEGRSPLLEGVEELFNELCAGSEQELVREVRLADATYEQHISYVPVSGLLRMHVRDITRRKRAEADRARAEEATRRLNETLEQRVAERTAALAASNAEMQTFSYSVAHDLRAPLRAIDGFSASLAELDSTKADPEASRVLAVVRRNAQHMGRLIDDLLEFSRTGRSGLQRRLVDMDELARSVLVEVLESAPEGRFRVAVETLLPAEADPVLVRKVWFHLLSNARKFAEGGQTPAITVRSRQDGNRTIYSVSDNGVGFDMQYVGKLFGVFQILRGQQEFEGTGIGLALVRRIVTLHGGEVWAQGAVGEGATFWFTLGPAC